MEQQGHADDDLAARLPDDVIADVLRRLEARWLAASRCVCKAWRSIVDTRSLLRTDLLPFSLSGIFIDFGVLLPLSEFFSRPAPSPEISGKLDFLPLPTEISKGIPRYNSEYVVRDHCNGLILVSNYVVNPATQRWDHLPEPQPDHHYKKTAFLFDEYLVFDPTVSPHYEVLMIPHLSSYPPPIADLGHLVEESEWPPSPCILRVFSSRSGHWEERSFVRQGNAAGTVAELHGSLMRLFSVHWRGSLYVHSQNFVMRISLSGDQYRVIKTPVSMGDNYNYHSSYLGRSEKGVYLASFVKSDLHVWILNESCGQLEWMLKGKYGLEPVQAFNRQVYGPWILQDNNYDFYRDHLPETNEKAILQEKFEWNSDDDNFLDNTDVVEACHNGYCYIEILGFHPYKEIIFLSRSKDFKLMATGFAYHLNSSKVEALGNIYPTHYNHFDIGGTNDDRSIYYSFPYTPCWIGEFPSSSEVI